MTAGADSLNSGTNNEVYGMNSAVLGGYQNEACDDEAVIANGNGNKIVTAGDYAVFSTIGGGTQNSITSSSSFIGSGIWNTVGGEYTAIAAGSSNSGAGDYDLIGAGAQNHISVSPESMIGAGYNNSIAGENVGQTSAAGGGYGFIGGGYDNAILGTSDYYAVYSDIVGGYSNSITGSAAASNASSSTIAGGSYNTVTASYAGILGGSRNSASAQYAAIAGGYGNAATGEYAIDLGGDANTAAGTLSLAGGYHADAVHSGSFVWSDYSSGSAALKDTVANQFAVRASGGVYLYSNEAMTAGVKLASGGGSWASLSDRNAKTGVVPLDDASILAKVAALPVSAWQYTSERGVRHVGPMAQDFYAAFGVGEDDRHITSIDEDGVALAAIKALNAKLARQNDRLTADARGKDAHLRALDGEVRELSSQMATLLGRR